MRVALHRISAAAFVAALALVPAGLLALRFAAADWLPADHLWLVDLGATGIAIGLAAQCVVLLWRLRETASRSLAEMAADLRDMRDEIDAQRRILIAAVDSAPAGAPASPASPASPSPDRAAIDDMASEVRVLQKLVADLSGRAAEPAGAAARGPRASAAMPAPAPPPPPPSSQPVQLRAVAAQEPRRAARPATETDTLSIVRAGLREGRVDVYIQPIVSLPQRKHRFYECFTRIRDAEGNVIGPDRYLAGAEREGLIGAIDNMLLFRSVQLVRRVHKANRDVGIFVNISEHSLADKRFFRDFAAFVSENKELAPYLIFEFAQAHVARHGAAVMLELERLARRGFRFSMDQVTDLDVDATALGERQFRFIKVDAQRLLQASRDESAPVDPRRFKAALERNHIDLVVERIESEQTLLELLDYPIDFGQGYLFGEPRQAKTAA
jgi:cyclic-di-GMP phosphodiesterase TipF (flagellum assembly factor)